MKRSLLSSLIAFLIMLIIMRVQGAPIAARVPGGILGLEFAWYDLVFEGKLLFIEHRIVILNIWLDFLFILAYTCFLVTACKAVGDRSGKTGAARFFARVVLLAGVFDVVENVAMLGRLYFWFGPAAPQVACICAALKFLALAFVLLFLLYALLSGRAVRRPI
jgi:hypothetical protein